MPMHVDRDDGTAKLWLSLVAWAANLQFPARELSRIERLERQDEALPMEGW